MKAGLLPQPDQYLGIQLLRFCAAMLVVVMHLTQAISIHITKTGFDQYWASGSAGVDIFFVISGFVMATSTRSLPLTASISNGWAFMKKRILRIAPLYWLYTALKLVLLLAIPGYAVRSSVEPGHALASFLFVPSTSPWQLIEPLLPVGWTLNFEMMFYAVFALAIAIGAPRLRFCLAAFVAVFVAAQFASGFVPLQFYGRSIIFEFILGICIARLCEARPMSPLPGLIALMSGLLLMFGNDWYMSVDRLLVWGCGAALVVAGAVWMEPWTATQPLAKKLSLLGDASYSIYLSHAFVVPLGVLAFKHMGMTSSFVIVPLLCCAAVLVGCMSYLYIERPMTRFLRRYFLEQQAKAIVAA